MAKTKKRKQIMHSAPTGRGAAQERESPARMAQRRVSYTRGVSLQNVAFAAMLTCGFLGLAIFFTFFYSADSNHYFYAGIAALTALGWLFALARRWSQYRQRAGA